MSSVAAVIDLDEFKEKEEDFDGGDEEGVEDFIVLMVGGVAVRVEAEYYDYQNELMVDFFQKEDGKETVVASFNKEFVIAIYIDDYVEMVVEGETSEEIKEDEEEKLE